MARNSLHACVLQKGSVPYRIESWLPYRIFTNYSRSQTEAIVMTTLGHKGKSLPIDPAVEEGKSASSNKSSSSATGATPVQLDKESLEAIVKGVLQGGYREGNVKQKYQILNGYRAWTSGRTR